MQLSKEAIVGLFTLLTGLVLFWATFYLGKLDVTFRGGETYSAVLESAHALGVDSQIEVAGVPVGRITSVQIVRGGTRALITFRLTEKIEIYRDASIQVLTSGFLGDRYAMLRPGTPEAGLLPTDEPIVDTNVPIALEEMMVTLTPLIEDASGMLREMRALLNREEISEGIPQTIDSLRHTALSLELVFADYEKYVSKFLRSAASGADFLADRLPEMFSNLEDSLSGGGDGIGKLKKQMKESLEQFDQVIDNMESMTSHLNTMFDDLNQGEGTIGALLRDEKVATEIRESIESLNETLGSIRKLRTTVSYLGSYEPNFNNDNNYWRHRFELQLQPSYDHYYSVGIADRSDSGKILFNAQIAKRFYDLTLRAGLLESQGGLGLDYAFWKDQFWLRAEAFDFGRTGDRPRVRTWAELRLFRHLTIAAGGSDLAGRNGPRGMFGVGIVFSDDDIRSLLGLARTATAF